MTEEDNLIYKLAGVKPAANTYRPATIGRRGSVRPGGNTLVANLKGISFVNPDQLRAQTPEHVLWYNPTIPYTDHDGSTNTMPTKRYRAIVGNNTKKIYAIMTNHYNIVQHSEILEALAYASEETGINVFGKVNDYEGRMHAHGFFADPSYTVEVLDKQDDPFMLGVRVYNSHNGQTGFGAEIFGIRRICFNYSAWGDSMGKIGWKHNVRKDDVVTGFAKVIRDSMDKVPVLANRMAKMNDEAVNIDEATAILYGISLTPFQANSITGNIQGLNPEIKDPKKIKVYDLYNAATAYVSYRPISEERVDGSVDISHKIEKLMIDNTEILYARGVKIIDKINEKKKLKKLKVDMKNTRVSMPDGW